MSKTKTISPLRYIIIGLLMLLIYFKINIPLWSSDWGKVNSIVCRQQTNRVVVCQHHLSKFLGLASENTVFNLVKVEISYELRKGVTYNEQPLSVYKLYFITDNEQDIEIDDYGQDFEHANRKKLLFDSLLRREQQSLTLKYGNGVLKIFIMGVELFLALILVIYVTNIG